MTTQPQGTAPDGSTSELLTALGHDVATLVREELERLRTELSGAAREARTAAVLLGGAGALGALAAGTSAGALVRALEKVLPKPLAPIAATAIYGTGALFLARRGLAELRSVRREMPDRLS